MNRLFRCPECGYKNYVTRADLDAEREGLKKPVRSFDSTFSAVTVLMEMFGVKRKPPVL